ncbi:MAG: cytochrome c biogenesis protein CcsA, partial [Candidatus Thalassarchaeaceae archaeon]|nr:cytochrome c biogenesis protein CcsA [Candidatus Thalassarchaeaceae archaeon]
VAFAVGTLGVGLGGLWAYTVLDWGGYWAWDPVETASLLPWVCLLLLLHLRVSPGKEVSKWAIPLAVLPGWFSIHATLVTRANGVWASVHAFIGDKLDNRSDSAIGRLIELQGEGLAGTEVTTYIVALVTILIITVAWLVFYQSGLGDQKRWRRVSRYSLFFILALPLSRFITVDMFGAEISWIELLPSVLLLLLASSSLIALFAPPNTILPNLFDSNEKLFSMVAILLLTYFIDVTVAILLCILMLLKVSVRSSSSGQSSNVNSNPDNFWTVAAVIVILTATYAFLIEVTSAGIALIIFLWPIFLRESDEEEQSLKDRLSQFCIRKEQLRLARYAPVVIGAIFLTLTWMLMIASIDGASLAMHEMFGGPLILLVAAALATYSWKDTVPSRWTPLLLLGFIVLGILLGVLLNLPLAGDSNAQFSDVVTRGDVAWLLLPMMVVAIPSLIRLVYDLSRKTIDGYSPAKLRSALAHAAHLGIILLLVGHIFTTTLVDRTDSSHQVVLVQDDQVSHEGLHLTFIEWTILSSDDETFSDRFKVGDGFLGAEIEVRDDSGKLLDTVNPGMLRFDDSNGFPRSEVARYSSWSGDTVFIFDWSQTQELGNASDTIDMASEE